MENKPYEQIEFSSEWEILQVQKDLARYKNIVYYNDPIPETEQCGSMTFVQDGKIIKFESAQSLVMKDNIPTVSSVNTYINGIQTISALFINNDYIVTFIASVNNIAIVYSQKNGDTYALIKSTGDEPVLSVTHHEYDDSHRMIKSTHDNGYVMFHAYYIHAKRSLIMSPESSGSKDMGELFAYLNEDGEEMFSCQIVPESIIKSTNNKCIVSSVKAKFDHGDFIDQIVDGYKQSPTRKLDISLITDKIQLNSVVRKLSRNNITIRSAMSLIEKEIYNHNTKPKGETKHETISNSGNTGNDDGPILDLTSRNI